MNEQTLQILREVIAQWKGERRFTYENKQVFPYKSPITPGEYLLRFSNSLNSFFCEGKLIEITLTSNPFHTATLSDNPLSDNINGDKYRLEKHLQAFDESFYAEVDKKLNDCIDTLSTSDPLFL